MSPEPVLLPIADAWARYGFPSEAALRQAMYRRQVPFVKRGRRSFIDVRAMDRHIADQTVEAR